MLGVPEFKIGHVDVHQAVHTLNAFKAVVGGSVVHEGQTQAPLDCDHERFENLRDNVLGRDEVDVVTTNSLQIEHDLRKFRRSHFRPFTKLAGLEILTKYATEIAPAKKDRARSVPPAQAIFLAKMRERAGHAGEPAALAYA